MQDELQRAASQVAAAPIKVTAAGRTDAGVHAAAQVVHFDTDAERSSRAWHLGINSALPSDVSIAWAMPVPQHFHARYAAIARSYRYYIFNRTTCSALVHARAAHIYTPLQQQLMQAAAASLLGEHDFSAFRAAQCQSHSPVRRLTELTVEREQDWVIIQATANAFLHHMVRNIVGLLIAIGAGKHPVEWAAEVLRSRDRRCSAPTAPACGLYLWSIEYPQAFQIPMMRSVMMPTLSHSA